MRMICFRCKNEIKENDRYYSIIEHMDGKEVHTDYVHKVCWDNFLKQMDSATSSLNKSNYLLNAMGSHMRKIGMIPDKEVII